MITRFRKPKSTCPIRTSVPSFSDAKSAILDPIPPCTAGICSSTMVTMYKLIIVHTIQRMVVLILFNAFTKLQKKRFILKLLYINVPNVLNFCYVCGKYVKYVNRLCKLLIYSDLYDLLINFYLDRVY